MSIVETRFATLAVSELRDLVAELDRRLDRSTAPLAQADDEFWLLLSRLLRNHAALQRKGAGLPETRGEPGPTGPYLIGVTGGVAVGKSTSSEFLRRFLSAPPSEREVELVTTDSFLYPNHVLERLGTMEKKGFPESFDVARLLSFLNTLKHRLAEEQEIPVYSHGRKDVLPGEFRRIRTTDILILEGVNLLTEQFYYFGNVFSVRDFLDCTIYLHAEPALIQSWFVNRFRLLRQQARPNQNAYFDKLMGMDDAQFEAYVLNIWNTVNLRLLNESILPNKYTVDIIVNKSDQHSVADLQVSTEFLAMLLQRERA